MSTWLDRLIGCIVLSAVPTLTMSASTETAVPRAVAGAEAKVFLLESRREGDIVKALHKDVGATQVAYFATEINCKTMRTREVGHSATSPKEMVVKSTAWFAPVPGSITADLAQYVCNNPRR